ncbi:MAG: monovalent cation/H+ antiporter complex subunit F [Lachnospiraceae bacterium]|nr:monovalent cation/H+ antiporter complex subunit F [Lachnospiraceae bacterium]
MSYEVLNTGFQKILVFCLILLAALVLVAVIRSFLGPRLTDRIIAINMIGTLTMVMILVLTVYLQEDYLADVSLIYAMISFLSVVVLTRIYTSIYREQQKKRKEKQADAKNREEDA